MIEQQHRRRTREAVADQAARLAPLDDGRELCPSGVEVPVSRAKAHAPERRWRARPARPARRARGAGCGCADGRHV